MKIKYSIKPLEEQALKAGDLVEFIDYGEQDWFGNYMFDILCMDEIKKSLPLRLIDPHSSFNGREAAHVEDSTEIPWYIPEEMLKRYKP